MPPKKQSNLDSFFGVSKDKRVQKQAKLTFGKQRKDKENKIVVADEEAPTKLDDDDDDDDDDEVIAPKPSTKRKEQQKRRIIEDDDDENETKAENSTEHEISNMKPEVTKARRKKRVLTEKTKKKAPPKNVLLEDSDDSMIEQQAKDDNDTKVQVDDEEAEEETPANATKSSEGKSARRKKRVLTEKTKTKTPPKKKAKSKQSGESREEESADEGMALEAEKEDDSTKTEQPDDETKAEHEETDESEKPDKEVREKAEDSEYEEGDDEDAEGDDEDAEGDEDAEVVKDEKLPTKSTDAFFQKQKSSSASKSKASGKKATVVIKPIVKKVLSKTEHLSYNDFCETMEEIEAITSRLEIQALMTALFSAVLETDHPKDLYDLVYLSSNSVAAAYECIELGIGDAILIKAIGEAYGTNPSIVKQKYESEGDLGTVAKASKGKQRTLSFGIKPKPLLAKDVLTVFREIAQTTGAHSQKWKVDKIKKLLVRAQGPEAKYIVRGLQGKLRIGLARSTVLISLAHAFVQTQPKGVGMFTEDVKNEDDFPEEAQLYRKNKNCKTGRSEAAVAIIKKAYSEVPSYDSLLDALLRVPLDQMHKACTLTPGIPVEPMLAKPTKSIQEVLKRLNGQRFTCEFKYDGERAQVHMLEDGSFKVFSRNLLDTSGKYPEVSEYVKEASNDDVTSYVLDTEVVAFNRETGKLVPFQVLSTRKKTEESAETAKVQVIVQAFDLMYLNGKSLLNNTLSERRALMKDKFAPIESKFQYAKSLDHKEDGDTTFLEEFLETAVKSQCEGLMVKTLDDNAAYEPSKRSLNWLKLKKDYLDGLGDSVDLVPLGAYYGRGKRTGTFGAYLLACYDPESEEFQSVCKIGTGFSDEDLKNLSESFNEHSIDKKASNYNTSDTLDCDVWFDAVQVWEVKAADLSKSSTHKGALGRTGEAGRGIGLRFPRFERVREDKKPEQATSSDQILEMYYQQDSVVNEDDGGDNDDGI